MIHRIWGSYCTRSKVTFYMFSGEKEIVWRHMTALSRLAKQRGTTVETIVERAVSLSVSAVRALGRWM